MGECDIYRVLVALRLLMHGWTWDSGRQVLAEECLSLFTLQPLRRIHISQGLVISASPTPLSDPQLSES